MAVSATRAMELSIRTSLGSHSPLRNSAVLPFHRPGSIDRASASSRVQLDEQEGNAISSEPFRLETVHKQQLNRSKWSKGDSPLECEGPLVDVRTHTSWVEKLEDPLTQSSPFQRNFGRSLLTATVTAALSLSIPLCGVDLAVARPEGVNRPDLLPETFTPVIDVAGFLSPQQEGRIAKDLTSLEEETGFKLRVLAQNYPETPGLAVKNYWQVDDNTIVFVADPNMGNILNFNVGATVDLNVPRSFWSRLAGKYGNIFFWREKGEDASIEAAVAAIGQCLREPAGPLACSEIK